MIVASICFLIDVLQYLVDHSSVFLLNVAVTLNRARFLADLHTTSMSHVVACIRVSHPAVGAFSQAKIVS